MKKNDFGDILNKWENGISQKNAMYNWLQNNKIYDKDANIAEIPLRGKNRRRLLNSKPDAILDIHGLSEAGAWLSLDKFFSDAKYNSYEKLRIIHGKGNRSQGEPVLLHTVRKYIEKCPFAGESGYEKAANGGTGATWVFIK
ncbi:MAG: Smr/MutS family protein [Treponema sp.]|jgi:DNA-nicking Smr family endonuclease|nr:Smr/MutS family protein [Treponema sp.]